MAKANGTPLKRAREAAGISVIEFSQAIGTHPKNYYRIERGEQVPKRELARAIYEYFDGELSFVEIYDPEYATEVVA